MPDFIRDLLLEPTIHRTLSVQVKDLILTSSKGLCIHCEGVMSCAKDSYVIEIISPHNEKCPMDFPEVGISQRGSEWKVTGLIYGIIPFEAKAWLHLPRIQENGGITAQYLRVKITGALELPPTGFDQLNSAEMKALTTGRTVAEKPSDDTRFSASVIFHGIDLKLQTHGTKRTTQNDFFGEMSGGDLDTHKFEGDGFEGALTQSGKELKLVIRSKAGSTRRWSKTTLLELVSNARFAVALSHDCQPWSCYQSVRLDHKIVQRMISPHTHLEQGVPTVEACGTHGTPNANSFIPTVIKGLGGLPASTLEMLHKFHWQIHGTETREVPLPVQLLVKCAATEGLLKVILDIPKGKNLPDAKTTRANGEKKSAFEAALEQVIPRLELSECSLLTDLYDTWKAHRNLLSHGWLDFIDDDDPGTELYHDRKLRDSYNRLLLSFLGFHHPIKAPSLQMKPKAP